MIDIAIIGSGPAGLSAAINAYARGRSTVVYGRGKEESFLYKAEKVNNHLGMPEQSGASLLDSFYAHAESLDIEVRKGRVLQILPMGDYFAINFNNEIESARAIVITTGIVKGNKIKGEDEFLGRGVSYCATCDGMLFRGKEVAIIAGAKEAEEDARFLSKIASKVYFLSEKGESFDAGENVEFIHGKPQEVLGGDFVSGLKTESRIIDCQGVFFVKAAMPFDSLINGVEVEDGALKTDRLMQTNIPGVFAAGDCTGWPYQLSKAIGEGLVAAQQADRYLSKLV